ncbi:putative porin [Flocculibacter collagenilyticus]|uniref:putative porin n=1 Tax=Flocculibacter collagenilyticus TaxID=2744479 RepID=UPI001F42B502|nr:putative porin [Flocculibacter collagenilyticus]
MMHSRLSLLALVATGACFSTHLYAEIDISGYGSIVAGRTLGTVEDPLNPGQERDEILTADFYDVGQYDNDFSFKPESVFGLQFRADLGESLAVTAQLVAKGTDDFEPEFDWFYLTYQATDDLTLMAGRRNIPMYYFSEFSEIGYAYPWVRPPSNLYWWQVTQFDGFHAMYSFQTGDYSNVITVFYGNETSNDNKELKYYNRLYGGNAQAVNEFWKNIIGFNWNFSGDFFDLRFVYFENDRERTTINADGSATDSDPFTQKFIGLGGTADLAQFTILFDMNLVEYTDAVGTEYPTYLVSVVYNIDEFHPYISYSKADHERTKGLARTENLEEHYMLSYGIRYDFHSNAALKVQYDKFVDQGDKATGWAYHGDSETITIGVDFTF